MMKLEYGSIYANGKIIENPAVMYDAELGTLHAWGEASGVKAKYDRWIGNAEVNQDPLFPNLVCLTFDKMTMTNEQIYKILHDMLHVAGYCKVFHRKFMLGK